MNRMRAYAISMAVLAVWSGSAAPAEIPPEDAAAVVAEILDVDLSGIEPEIVERGGERYAEFWVHDGPHHGCYSVSLTRGWLAGWTLARGLPPSKESEPLPSPQEALGSVQDVLARTIGVDPLELEWDCPEGVSGRIHIDGESIVDREGQPTYISVGAVVMAGGAIVSYNQVANEQYPVPANIISREEAIAIGAAAFGLEDAEVDGEARLGQWRGVFRWYVKLQAPESDLVYPDGSPLYPYVCEIDALSGQIESIGWAGAGAPMANQAATLGRVAVHNGIRSPWVWGGCILVVSASVVWFVRRRRTRPRP